jgi:hypothetical protein
VVRMSRVGFMLATADAVHGTQGSSSPVARSLGLLTLMLACGAVLSQRRGSVQRSSSGRHHQSKQAKTSHFERQGDPIACSHQAASAVGRLHASAAMLASSVLADSALEHYRGGFENPGMLTPLITSLAVVVAGVHGQVKASAPLQAASCVTRARAYATAVTVGVVGIGFHIYNILRRPGTVSWSNLFYAAPVGAPAALSLAGLLGLSGERIRGGAPGEAAKLYGMPAGRALSGLTGLGLAGTIGEAGLLHFRGAFHNPLMWLPVSLPPVASALMFSAAVRPPSRGSPMHRITRGWLTLTAVLGIGGVGLHAYGVSRQMGGWKNWQQNVQSGPPIPAPPAFSALAMAAGAALSLIDSAGFTEERRS